MYKVLNILIGIFLLNVLYSQNCTANAGGDLEIPLIHDGNPGGEVTFDGTGTTGNYLDSFIWEFYHLPEDTLVDAYTSNSLTPTIDINCYATQNPDGTWTNCLAEYRVVLYLLSSMMLINL